MSRPLRRVLCALLCLCLLSCPSFAAAFADGGRERPELEDVRVYVCSLLSGRAYLNGDTVYMSLSDLGRIYNISVSVSVSSGSFSASAPGLEIYGEKDSGYITANCRYLYVPSGYLVCGDDVYLPLDALCRIFGVSAGIDAGFGHVDISTAQPRLISGSEDYYTMNFSADELYWLPRIGYTEAYEQPLAGIMGVCNVVLNRVNDKDFPDTIFEVLYDSKHTVQFTPASTGAMHSEPDEIYYIAAYLVLEGYNTVGKSTYFVNPVDNANYWFRENLAYVTTIGNHEFYR